MTISAANSILDLIGNTPLVRVPETVTGSKAQVFAKLESANPAGSIKDRMAKYVLCEEERRGRIRRGDTICDATSGNTGVAVALVAAVKGFRTIFTTPTTTSDEKVNLMKSYGADVIVTPANVPADDPRSCYSVVARLAAEHGYYLLNQFDNQLNPEAHYRETGPEIWNQTNGRITHLVAGIGTGGTISGVGRFLKERNNRVQVIGVEPEGSFFQSIHANKPFPVAKPHFVEGIGTEKEVAAFHKQYVDRVIQVDDARAIAEARYLCRVLGLSVGGSTGAIFAGVREICRDLPADAVVTFFVCDGGIRYISKIFCDQWLREQKIELKEGEVVYE